ncbi:hypothetical protein J6590_045812 [Homalodisca vitripennis]|nr:hypothetical protein J6590_045812 [Homalodisca vitripennis]
MVTGALEGQCAASAIIHYPNMCRSSPVKKNSSLPETQPRSSQDGRTSKDVDTCVSETKRVTNLLTPDDIIRYYREAIVHYSKYQNANVIETEACYKAAKLAIQQHAYLQAANFLHSVILINLALNEEEKIERLMSLSELYTKIGFQRKASFYRRLAATRFVSARNPQTNWQQCYNLMLQALSGHKLSLDPADHSPDKLEGWPGLQKQVLQDLVLAATRVGQSAVATRHMTFLLQVMWGQLTAAERHESALQLQSLAAQCEGAPVPLVLDSGLVIPPVNLVMVPTTESFVVQNLKSHLRPVKLEKTKENFGPFLFTPINFGSLERKSNKASNKIDYLWVAEELCEVKLELSNPFPFELEVSNMRLLTSGAVFESLPLTLTLPPDATNVGVTLSGTSKEVGQLEITGYSTHTLGVKSNCRLKNIPKIGESMFSVEVIPALPLLQLSEDDYDRRVEFCELVMRKCDDNRDFLTNILFSDEATFFLNGNVNRHNCRYWASENPHWITESHSQQPQKLNQDGAPPHYGRQVSSPLPTKTNNGASISLYAGESVDSSLLLENVGQLPIQWVEVSVECLQDSEQVLRWDLEPLLAQLPLQPGAATTLPLHFFGAASFLSSSNPDTASVKSSIFSAPSSFLSSTSNRPGFPDRFLAKSTTSSFKSGGSSLNSFGSQFSKLCLENSPKALQCQLKVRYSSDPGMAAGFCRVATFLFSIEINCSVFVTNWDVIPAETSSQFYLVLDIANMTSQELELKYGTNKSLLMEENESCRIPIPVERCPLTKIGKLFKTGESVSDLMELNKSCSSHIAALVDLEWSLVAGSRCGKASLHGITLSLSMLDIVRMSPISWEVSVNGSLIEPHEELNSQVGQSLLLGFNILNSLSWPLHDLELKIQFFQDHQNGITSYQLDTRVACSGATCVQLEEVAEFGSAYHECVVVFLTPGQYKVNIQCTSKEKHIWKLIPHLVIQVSKP